MNNTNSEFSPMGFPFLRKMVDAQLRIFFSKYSNAFSTSDILHSSYRKTLKVIEEANGEVEYNKDKINDNTFSGAL